MNPKKTSLEKKIATQVTQELVTCIKCGRCLEVCPVTKENITITDLNQATKFDAPVSDHIKQFAFSCVQCRRCVPVCPVNLHRDQMILFLRYKLRKIKPYGYKRYLAIRGPELSPIARTAQGLFTAMKLQKAPDLARYMETEPKTNASVLFYPGCYLYSFEVIRRTKRLLDHVGIPYNILGGLTTCCGIPQLLQGEFELAERNMNILHDKIQRLHPATILTGCAECYEALIQIKEMHKDYFEVLTTVEYLMNHIDRFPQIKLREQITFHDSCRLTRQFGKGTAARKAIATFSQLIEMENIKETSLCCYHWNHDYDTLNTTNRNKRLTEASCHASTMACDCITCYEEFQKIHSSVEVIDILQLFEEALSNKNTSQPKDKEDPLDEQA